MRTTPEAPRARHAGAPKLSVFLMGDATGTYQTQTGEVVKFNGVRDLAKFLAGSEEVHEAFVEQLFHYFVKQPVRAYGPRKLAELRQSFAENGFSVRKLLVEIMAESALAPREQKVQVPGRDRQPSAP